MHIPVAVTKKAMSATKKKEKNLHEDQSKQILSGDLLSTCLSISCQTSQMQAGYLRAVHCLGTWMGRKKISIATSDATVAMEHGCFMKMAFLNSSLIFLKGHLISRLLPNLRYNTSMALRPL